MSAKSRTSLDQRSKGLRQAASTVFVLIAVLPLLILTLTLARVHALQTLDAQIGLSLAVAVALIGLVVFRRLMAQLSDVILALRALVAKREAPTDPAKGIGTTTRLGAHRIPGVGEIGELRDIEATLAARWRAESSAYVGQRVLVYVLNSWTPIVGILQDVTADGVLVKGDRDDVAIGYRRFLGIKPAEA